MSETLSIPGRNCETILLRHRVVSAFHEGSIVTVVQEHGQKTCLTCDTMEAAKALLDEIRAWLDGGA